MISVTWLIIGMSLIIVEMIVPSFLAVLVGIPAIISGLVSLIYPSLYLSLSVFIVSSILCLLYLRPFLKKRFAVSDAVRDISQDEIIGQEGFVTKINENNEFIEVRVNGQYWTAVSNKNEEFDIDSRVKIEGLEGVKLIVSKIN